MGATDDSELLAYLSHELRTGLNAMVGHAQLLKMGKLDHEEAKSVERIIDAGFYLVGILDEVGEIAADELLREDRVVRETIDLGPLLEQLCELLGPLAGAQGVSIAVTPVEPAASQVIGCRRRLTQILLNLLSNAIKYGGDRVTLGASRSGDYVEIAVTDAGPGIDANRIRDLFEPFERLGAEQGPAPGSGIGLALSRRIADLAGAKLAVRSEIGEGATFIVALAAAGQRDSASA
jgi:signal transduction histidine kinase